MRQILGSGLQDSMAGESSGFPGNPLETTVKKYDGNIRFHQGNIMEPTEKQEVSSMKQLGNYL